MVDLFEMTGRMRSGENLGAAEAAAAAGALASEEIPDNARRAFLVALGDKGETAEEVAAIADAFRGMARDPGLGDFASRAVDVVGTGGDRFGSFNVSTASALLVAAAGVPVFKHGNRSITSNSGSADFLEALGIAIEVTPAILRRSMEELSFAFFFAPAFHPAFRQIMPVRKALAAEGRRTVFNILGPLINPGRPAFSLLGVYDAGWVAPLAEALGRLGASRALVANTQLADGRSLDEILPAGQVRWAGAGGMASISGLRAGDSFGLGEVDPERLTGGNALENAAVFEALVEGRSSSEIERTVSLNAGCALWCAGEVDSLEEGISRIREVQRSGTAHEWLTRARNFYREISG